MVTLQFLKKCRNCSVVLKRTQTPAIVAHAKPPARTQAKKWDRGDCPPCPILRVLLGLFGFGFGLGADGELLEEGLGALELVGGGDVREASQTYSKGNFGYPMSGGFLELDLVEAAFLVQANRLEVFHKKKRMGFAELFDYASGKVDNFDIKYIVFTD